MTAEELFHNYEDVILNEAKKRNKQSNDVCWQRIVSALEVLDIQFDFANSSEMFEDFVLTHERMNPRQKDSIMVWWHNMRRNDNHLDEVIDIVEGNYRRTKTPPTPLCDNLTGGEVEALVQKYGERYRTLIETAQRFVTEWRQVVNRNNGRTFTEYFDQFMSEEGL